MDNKQTIARQVKPNRKMIRRLAMRAYGHKGFRWWWNQNRDKWQELGHQDIRKLIALGLQRDMLVHSYRRRNRAS